MGQKITMKIIRLSYRQFSKSTHYDVIDRIVTKPPMSPKQAFEAATQALNEAIGGMEPGVKYKAEHLFLSVDWDRMSNGITRKVGMCLSYLTASDLIPLQYANRPGSTNKSYMLKPGFDPEGCLYAVCFD